MNKRSQVDATATRTGAADSRLPNDPLRWKRTISGKAEGWARPCE